MKRKVEGRLVWSWGMIIALAAILGDRSGYKFLALVIFGGALMAVGAIMELDLGDKE